MSQISVALEQVFLRNAHGQYGSLSTFDDAFWSRYLEIFNEVRIVARVRHVEHFPDSATLLSDPRIVVIEIPFYRGPLQYLCRRIPVQRSLARAAQMDGAWIIRAPGLLGTEIARRLNKSSRSYGVELVGDPEEILKPGGAGSPLIRPFLRRWYVQNTRKICARAAAVAYVSNHVLPSRYPAAPSTPTEHYSSIDLPAERFARHSRDYCARPTPIRLLTVGSLAYRIKGVDVLLAACATLKDRGYKITLDVIGDGVMRAELEILARELNIDKLALFRGHLPRDEVFSMMDQCDIFVLASRSEGLPRVVVEAMTRAAPCVSTDVGGIPELLEPEWLVPSDDPNALADAIARAAASPDQLMAMSARNLHHARNYESGILSGRRERFYSIVRDMAEVS